VSCSNVAISISSAIMVQGLPQYAASEIAADEIAAKIGRQCKRPIF